MWLTLAKKTQQAAREGQQRPSKKLHHMTRKCWFRRGTWLLILGREPSVPGKRQLTVTGRIFRRLMYGFFLGSHYRPVAKWLSVRERKRTTLGVCWFPESKN